MSAAPAAAFEDIFNLDRFKVVSGSDRIEEAAEYLQSCCAQLNLANPPAVDTPVWLYGRMLAPMRKWDNNHLEFLLEDDANRGRFICCIDYGRKMNEGHSKVYFQMFESEYFKQAYPELGVCGRLIRNDHPGHPICPWRPDEDLLLDVSVVSPVEQFEKGDYLYLYYPKGILTSRINRHKKA